MAVSENDDGFSYPSSSCVWIVLVYVLIERTERLNKMCNIKWLCSNEASILFEMKIMSHKHNKEWNYFYESGNSFKVMCFVSHFFLFCMDWVAVNAVSLPSAEICVWFVGRFGLFMWFMLYDGNQMEEIPNSKQIFFFFKFKCALWKFLQVFFYLIWNIKLIYLFRSRF